MRDLDRQIGENLQASGVAVVSVDSLHYFWQAKTPLDAANDLGAMIDHYTQSWARPSVILVGYSFGADILPFAINRLRPAAQDRFKEISLLGLSTSADFEIHVGGWLSEAPSGEALPTVPELQRLDAAKVQCVYGEEEEGTACVDPSLHAFELIKTAGGHHFDGNYSALAATILEGARRRSG